MLSGFFGVFLSAKNLCVDSLVETSKFKFDCFGVLCASHILLLSVVITNGDLKISIGERTFTCKWITLLFYNRTCLKVRVEISSCNTLSLLYFAECL